MAILNGSSWRPDRTCGVSSFWPGLPSLLERFSATTERLPLRRTSSR